jgi:hypothetical protein
VYQDNAAISIISPHRRNGLILCRDYHAEFIGPGAVVGRIEDDGCKSIIAIGTLELLPIDGEQSLQDAYRRRIQWSYWLNKITQTPSPEARAAELLSSFDAFFEPEVVSTLPVDLLAMLIGVLPHTMAAVRQTHYRSLDGLGEGSGLEGWVDRVERADRLGHRSPRSWRPLDPKEFQLSMVRVGTDRAALVAV